LIRINLGCQLGGAFGRTAANMRLPAIVVGGEAGSRGARAQAGTGDGGGAEGNRTPDLLIANEALSQLSYSPIAGYLTSRMTLVARRPNDGSAF
jgi:hypothetical protein